jgi:hypothetical protein
MNGGIADQMAMRRSIAPGCATLLEDADDTNNSVGDFAEVTPAPRNNLDPIQETSCSGGGGALNPPTVPSAGTPGQKTRTRRCKKKPSKNSAGAAKKKACKKKRK